MWKAALDVDRIHPRPRPVHIGRQVDERARIEHHRVRYTRIVSRYPFELRARRFDSPDVPVIGRHAANEINESIVGGPDWKMAMDPGRCHVDSAVAVASGLSWLLHEQRIAWRGRVVHEPLAIAGPVELGRILQIGS